MRARDDAAAQVATDARREKRARIAIALCALVLLLGGFFAEKNRSPEIQKSRAAAALLPPTQMLALTDGTRMSAREVVDGIDDAIRFEKTVFFVLGAAFLLLFLWSFRAPAHAMIVALSLFVLNIIVGAVIDPSSITRGLAIKVIIITTLAAGILAARRPENSGETPASPRAKRRGRPRTRSA